MLGWIIVVAVTALLSYLADVGVLEILSWPVPFFGGSTISVILMITCIMMLLRAARMTRQGEKETLRKWVSELQRELESARQASGQAGVALPEKKDEEA